MSEEDTTGAEPRHIQPTAWEEEHIQSAIAANDKSDQKVQGLVESGDKQLSDIQELVETSKQIQASAAAVEKMTRESLVSENRSVRRRNVLLTFLVCVLLLSVGALLYRDLFVSGPQRDEITSIATRLEECTTPGPRTPTADDPRTGNKCFDDGQKRTEEAILAIIDADHNGKIDSVEILNYLKQFDKFLNYPPAPG